MTYNIKKLLQEREKGYIQKTEEILLGFFQPLKGAIEDVIYYGEDVNMVIKGLKPISQNLNYISISLNVANYNVGDLIPVRDEEDSDTYQRTVEITEKNFWKFADLINLNVPISILETKDEEVIREFIGEIYKNEIPVPEDEDAPEVIKNILESAKNSSSDSEDATNLEMDDAQKSVYELYSSSKGSSH
jgi:hypothetical protein